MTGTTQGTRGLSILILLLTAAVGLTGWAEWQRGVEQSRLLKETVQLQRQLLSSQQVEPPARPVPIAGAAGSAPVIAGDDSLWRSFQVQLVHLDGSPAAGHVSLIGEPFQGKRIEQEADADPSGLAEFGTMPPGQYLCSVSVSHGDLKESTSLSNILIGPGRSQSMRIICPAAPPPLVLPSFEIAVPDSLAEVRDQLYYLARVSVREREIAGKAWNVSWKSEREFLLNSQGKILGTVTRDDVQEMDQTGLATSWSQRQRIPAGLQVGAIERIPAAAGNVRMIAYIALKPPAEGPLPELLLASWTDHMHGHFPDPDGHEPRIKLTKESDPGFWKSTAERIEELTGRTLTNQSHDRLRGS